MIFIFSALTLKLQAYKANIICPNKHQDDPEKFYNNRLLESETYMGAMLNALKVVFLDPIFQPSFGLIHLHMR